MKLAVQSLVLILASALSSMIMAEPTPSLDDQNIAPDDKESWYQIELLIYANEDAEAIASETWPEEANYPDTSTGILLTHKNIQKLKESIDNPTETPSDSQSPNNAIISENLDAQLDKQVNRDYIKLLPAKHKTFNQYLDKLDQAGTYRVLFHETWRQSLVDMNDAPPVVIEGGIQQNDYHELAGLVKFSVNRYLHIQTDLSLNTFGTAIQEEEAQKSPINNIPVGNELNDQGLLFPEPNFSSSVNGNNILVESEIALVPVQSIPLQQTRRMRSKELHYIDHPLMGVLVRLEPYEPPAKPASIESLELENAEPIELDSLLDKNSG